MKYPIKALLMLSVICFGSTTGSAQTDTQNMLIQKMLTLNAVQNTKHGDKLIIMVSDYCVDNDCKHLFKNYQNEVIVYLKEDIFMRGIMKYIKITALNTSSKKMYITCSNNGSSSDVVVEL